MPSTKGETRWAARLDLPEPRYVYAPTEEKVRRLAREITREMGEGGRQPEVYPVPWRDGAPG
jgi:hypothetical protein